MRTLQIYCTHANLYVSFIMSIVRRWGRGSVINSRNGGFINFSDGGFLKDFLWNCLEHITQTSLLHAFWSLLNKFILNPVQIQYIFWFNTWPLLRVTTRPAYRGTVPKTNVKSRVPHFAWNVPHISFFIIYSIILNFRM
jgi:hypothetical protein